LAASYLRHNARISEKYSFGSYRIIYRIVGERVDVLAVIHGSRDLWGQEPKPWETA
jgi:plasmid stabilization system protein ParE